MPIGRRPSIAKRNERKAAREGAVGPEAPWIRSREGPLEGSHTGEITINSSSRDFLVCASQRLRPFLTPQVELVLILFVQLGDQGPARGVHDSRPTLYHFTRISTWQNAALSHQQISETRLHINSIDAAPDNHQTLLIGQDIDPDIGIVPAWHFDDRATLNQFYHEIVERIINQLELAVCGDP